VPRRRRRRRTRRGSLDRPVNGQLYRSAFLVVTLPLLLAAFSIRQPGALQKPQLPPAFDTAATIALARDFATQYPDRRPGGANAAAAAQWFRSEIEPYGLAVSTDTWKERVVGLGVVQLENVVAVAPGQSPDAIVIVAHRDDLGTSPGADDNASGTAALLELARSFAQPDTEAQGTVQSPRTLVFVSTDGGAYGGLGAARFAATSPYRGHIVAAVNLDAIAGRGAPSVAIAGDTPRSPTASLIATASARVLDQTGQGLRHASFVGQLIDLGFPFTLYEQGPFVGDGVPAITITTGGDRPPPAFGDRTGRLATNRFAQLGRAAQELLGSLNQGLELAPSTASFVWIGGHTISGWAVELVLISLLIPFLVAVVDLYALGRRNRVGFAAAARALGNRIGFWLYVGIVFTCFRGLGFWLTGPKRPLDPAQALVGDWNGLALFGLAALALLGWPLARHNLVPRRPATVEEQLAGSVVALAALAIVALLVTATNPFALIFVLPALHAWLWLPQLARKAPWLGAGVFLLGLIGPGLILLSLGWRFGLGLDAPWYLLELVSVGWISATPVVLTLAGTAAAAQLAAIVAGRYAAYPERDEREPRGPFRATIRALILAERRRRATA
jgi:hypothetical protein